MIESLIAPLTILVEHIHLLGDVIGVNHVQVNALILLEEELPRGAPVVVRGDWDDLLHGDIELVHTAHSQDMHVKVACLGIKLHAQHEGLVDEA